MSRPLFAAKLLSIPGFADEAEYQLGEAARRVDALGHAIDAAAARLQAGEAPKAVAFDLVVAQAPVQTLAAFAEVTEADRTYLHNALETADDVRGVAEGLVSRITAVDGLQRGLRQVVAGVDEIRLMGPRIQVDLAEAVGGLLEALRGDDGVLPGDAIYWITATVAPEHPKLWRLVEEALAFAIRTISAGVGWAIRRPEEGPRTASLGLDLDLLHRPAQASLLDPITSYLTAAQIEAGVEPGRARAISAMVPPRFEVGIWQWLYAVPGALSEAEPPDEPGSIDPLTLKHRARLASLALHPVLGESFALFQIYQRPRGELKSKSGQASSPNEEHAKEPPRVVDVHAELDRWLAIDDPKDAIRIISGAPGAGKSSLARMYAAERAEQPGTTVYVALYAFDLADDFRDAIRATTDLFDPFDPERGPLLLILDGLDEFAQRGPTGANAVGRLVGAVCQTAELLNQDRVAMRAILLGREMVVQGIGDRFRRPGQIIHLMPFRVDAKQFEKHADPDSVRDVDQRPAWWRRYGELTGEPLTGIPPEIDTDAFAPLTEQPLLNMLLAIARRDGLLSHDDAGISLGELYRRLIEQVYERVHASDGGGRLDPVQRVKFADYERFLWAIAESAWHGAGRTTTLADVRRLLTPRLASQLDVLAKGAEDRISRLMTAFYFREHRGADAETKTFEFTHQSFGEYLLARRLIDFLELLTEERERAERGRGGWSEAEAALRWYQLFGPAPIEPHVVDFLANEVERAGAETAGRWQSEVARIMSGVIGGGFPLARGERLSFADETRRSRNAGEAVLVIASICARVSGQLTSIGQGHGTGFSAWLGSIAQPRFELTRQTLVLAHLDRLDLHGGGLLELSLQGCDLTNTRLDGGFLVNVNLRRANLDGVSALGCLVIDTRLDSASLRGARMSTSFFVDFTYERDGQRRFMPIRLHNVDLHGADMSGVSFEPQPRFIDCRADENTQWPDDFDPVAAGIRIESSD